MKTRVRELLEPTDEDHLTFELYEARGGNEVKSIEIVVTR